MSLQRIRESINCKRPSVIGTFYSLASSTTSFKEKLQTFAFHQSPDPVWPQSSFEKTDFHTISVTAAVSQTRDTVPHITVETNFKPILRAPNYSTHLGISTAIASSPLPTPASQRKLLLPLRTLPNIQRFFASLSSRTGQVINFVSVKTDWLLPLTPDIHRFQHPEPVKTGLSHPSPTKAAIPSFASSGDCKS